MSALMGKLRRNKDDADTEEKLLERLEGYPHLVALKPKEKMVFHSDYIQVDDDYVTTVLDFFHAEELIDSFGPFWGANLIPVGLDERGVTTMLFEQTNRMTDAWIDKHQTQSDRLGRMSEREQKDNGSTKGRQKIQKLETDREIVFRELQAGGVYLNVHFSMLVKAPDIETLDFAVDQIGRQYTGVNMSNIRVGVYEGEQKNALTKLFSLNKKKRNSGAYFTSQEFAGKYNLITNGFDDPEGEYIGKMLYDYNRSANIFDVDNYQRRVVVAHPKRLRTLGNAYYSDAWASKMSQAAMQNNHKVVHIVLSEATDLDRLGPLFKDITRRVDMRAGEINMFEVFGDPKDEMSLFPRNSEKLKLMTDQLFEGSADTKALAIGYLADILEEFYIETGMWVENAAENREDIRLVGIPHDKVPRLRLFRDYVTTRYETSKRKGDSDMTTAFNLLSVAYSNLLTSNGDLFDRFTSDTIDKVHDGRRVIYDFSGLIHRGRGVAMAQLVNVISFAVSTLSEGDVVIIHGADHIVNTHDFRANDLKSNEVKVFIDKELKALLRRGGRVVYTYESIEAMLDDRDFNEFDKADYTVLGAMSANTVNRYEEALGKRIPDPVKSVISQEALDVCFIRRGIQNVAFQLDLALGFRSDRTDMAPRELSHAISPSGHITHGDTQGSLSTARHNETKWSTGADRRAQAREKSKTLPRRQAKRRSLAQKKVVSHTDTPNTNTESKE